MQKLKDPRVMIIIGSLALIAFNALHYFTRNMKEDFTRGAMEGVFLGIAIGTYLMAARINARRSRCA